MGARASLHDGEKEEQQSTGSSRYGVVRIDVIIVFAVNASSSMFVLLSIATKLCISSRSSWRWRSRGTWSSSRMQSHGGGNLARCSHSILVGGTFAPRMESYQRDNRSHAVLGWRSQGFHRQGCMGALSGIPSWQRTRRVCYRRRTPEGLGCTRARDQQSRRR